MLIKILWNYTVIPVIEGSQGTKESQSWKPLTWLIGKALRCLPMSLSLIWRINRNMPWKCGPCKHWKQTSEDKIFEAEGREQVYRPRGRRGPWCRRKREGPRKPGGPGESSEGSGALWLPSERWGAGEGSELRTHLIWVAWSAFALSFPRATTTQCVTKRGLLRYTTVALAVSTRAENIRYSFTK